MPTKKKLNAAEPEAVKFTEPAAPVKKSTARPAATHKTAVRKTAAPKSTAKKTVEAKPAFDPSLHHDEIAHEAYVLWLNRGQGHGQAHEDWLQAIEIVRVRHQNS